ncbi:MAG TPA: M1 family metallopeptidase [Anaerolineae bacterium]|nr:M1 family metallopeptidase [Anaerolineae bacterium]
MARISSKRLLLCLALVAALAGCGSAGQDPGETRLPPTAAPTATEEVAGPLAEYHLELSLDVAAARLSGKERVTVPNHTGAPLDEIVFRLYPNLPQRGGAMAVRDVTVEGRPAAFSLRAENTSLVIPLEQPLPVERDLSVELAFDLEVPLVDEGYVLLGHSQGIWSLADAYALLAVHDGEAWREDVAPAHGDAVTAAAATYDVLLTLPADLVLVTTGAKVGMAPAPSGGTTYHLAGGPLREFAWLASADYRVSETTAYGTLLRSYYLPGDEAAGQATLNVAAAALRAYEDAFGPYPYQEMAVVEAPLLHFGMEFPGLNLIGSDLYRDQRAQLEDRVVHEIAHQWWYAQVGNDQVNTPWLDEGLAEYSMAFYYRQVYGEAHVNTVVNQRWLVPYQVAIDNSYDAVVNQPSSAFAWEYEVIVYAKAALFFHELHTELGDEVFSRVLQTYLSRYQWQIATPDDFMSVAEEVSGQDLDGLYNRWILSAQ